MIKKYFRNICYLCFYLTVICTLPANTLLAQSVKSEDETAIRDQPALFYEGLNTHDAEKQCCFQVLV